MRSTASWTPSRMPNKEEPQKPLHPNTIAAQRAREAGLAAARKIERERKADIRNMDKARKLRRVAMLEASRHAGIAAGLGIDVQGIAGQINEAVPRVLPLLEEINERLKRIEEKLNS